MGRSPALRDLSGEEEFRASRHSLPLAGQLCQPPSPSLEGPKHPERLPPPGAQGATRESPDSTRVVLHLDVDAFYAQVEEVREPSLRDRPVGITQKYLVVTCNYPARRSGVTKLMGTKEALRVCPDLVLISGEDLTPYRAASRRIQAVLERFGAVERLGMDECFLDVTAEAQRRLGSVPRDTQQGWKGHLHVPGGAALEQDNPHRPQDLRVAASASFNSSIGSGSSAQKGEDREALQQAALAAEWSGQSWWAALLVGSHIASEVRGMVRLETGFRCSCGVSCNKMLSKLISGLHKPDDQTVLLPPHAKQFMASLPLKAIPGVGYKMSSVLKERLKAEYVWELRLLPPVLVSRELGDAKGKWLLDALQGIDPQQVAAKGPPKSITVEDSFKSCDSHEAALQVLRVLAPDLLSRLEEDAAEFRRAAATLTVRWRSRVYSTKAQQHGQQQAAAKPTRTFRSSSASCPMPVLVHSSRASREHKAELIVGAAASVLRRHLPAQGFSLAALNLGAANLQPCSGSGSSSEDGFGSSAVSIQQLLQANKRSRAQPLEQQQHVGQEGKEEVKEEADRSRLSPAAGGLSGRALADASAMLRRSYSGARSPGEAPLIPLISKRQEREMRESQRRGLAPEPPVPASPCLLLGSGSSSRRDPPRHPLSSPAAASPRPPRSPNAEAALCDSAFRQSCDVVQKEREEAWSLRPICSGEGGSRGAAASGADEGEATGCGNAEGEQGEGVRGAGKEAAAVAQEDEDHTLALRLQQEEVEAFRRASSGRSSSAAAVAHGPLKKGQQQKSGPGRRTNKRPAGSNGGALGPLDAFVTRQRRKEM